ncbi:hypothetical protein O181_096725 [Austropuccinia psidii MF-1]|uniref:Uncharacterized protein n=1 Tax=Austropuccinia psidii MF-1 TaxID=1389203 RepID=A0A9Q3J637_9BASI|nr:hypothetical protein [Austropuccinia psidii MF-1]
MLSYAPPTGHTQATSTRLQEILLPVFPPAMFLVGWLVMFAWGSPTAGHFLHILTRPAQAVGPGLQPKIPLGGWPLFPEFCTRMRQRPLCKSRWISTHLKRNRGECICGSRLTVGAPFDHATDPPLEAQ